MPHRKDRIFGEWMQGSQPPEVLHADHILGAQLSHDTQGRPEWVEIQWQEETGPEYRRMQLDFPNAMFLLSLLKSIQLESGIAFPDDPRG
jgi:hypothetical protein